MVKTIVVLHLDTLNINDETCIAEYRSAHERARTMPIHLPYPHFIFCDFIKDKFKDYPYFAGGIDEVRYIWDNHDILPEGFPSLKKFICSGNYQVMEVMGPDSDTRVHWILAHNEPKYTSMI